MKKIIFSLLTVLCSCAALFAQVNEAANQNRIGVENGKTGRYAEAAINFSKSIELYDKESAKTIHNIGWLYELRGDDENALLFYEEALNRSPDQAHTLERAGFLLYKKTDYTKSIVYGEKVMKIDPLNQDVIKWLPDAYAQLFKQKQQVITKVAEDKELKKFEEKAKEQKKEEKKERKYLSLTYDITSRMSYLRADKSGFEYTPTDSYYVNIPMNLALDITPGDAWEFKADAGIPYYGALLPDAVWLQEKAEGYFYKKYYFLGMGLMGNHYGGKDLFGETVKLSDYKLGIIFGKFQDRSRFDFILYPRLFPADTGTTTGKTMDVDTLEIKYWYLLTADYKLYGSAVMRDFYFFDNALMTADYYGVYDFSAGVGYNDKPAAKWTIRFDITEKMYLENLNNERPYKFGNGQGVFGLDAYQWLKGKPLSGIKTFSTGFSIYVEEHPIPHLYFYQKVYAEFVRANQRANDFCLTIGVGGTY